MRRGSMPGPAIPNEGDDMLVHVGSTAPWTFFLFDANGACEDLSDVDAATFVLAPKATSLEADLLVQFSLDEGDLEVHHGTDPKTDPSYIRMTPTQEQADALTPGVFLGLGNLKFGDDGWMPTEELRVRVKASAAIKVEPTP